MTVLTLDEEPRLRWRKELTEYYRKTGDWTVYSLFPCIIASYEDVFDERMDIGDGEYSFQEKAVWDGRFSLLPPARPGTEGLFVSASPEASEYSFPALRTTVSGIALIDYSGESFRILRFRHLRKDRGISQGNHDRQALGDREFGHED